MSNRSSGINSPQIDEQALDLYSLAVDVGKHWLSILLLSFAAGMLSFVILSGVNHLKYATALTLVVTNVNGDINTNNSSGTDVYENLNYAADSASRLKNILESKELKETVAKELGLKAFEGTTSAETLGESNLLEVTVRAQSPYISYKEAVSILNNYMKFSSDLVGGTYLTVLEYPKVPEKPEHPYQNLRNAILMGIVVLILLCGLLSFLSFTRDTIRTSKEVESKIDAKLLATIVHEKKYRRGKKRIGGEKASILITDPVTSFEYAEGMRKLAARILNEMTDKHQKVLLVSSAMENEGKSTVAANIALAMSQIDKKVLIVDMDFRKPSMYKILNMQEAGFTDLHSFISERNGKKVSDLICRIPGTDLSAVLNRKAIPQAMEKYSETIKDIISELRSEADYIVIDTAPISLVSDAEELVPLVDTSIIVIRQHLVEAREINDTIDVLGGRNHMLGCVFNNARKNSVNTSAAGYGYGGHYAG